MAEPPRSTLPGDPVPQRWIRLVWAGDIDAFTVQALVAPLRDAWEQDPLVLEVDLTDVTFMDPAGLRPLVEAHARLQHRMRLFDPAPAVTRLLQLLGLEDMFLVVGPLPAGRTTGSLTWQERQSPGGRGADAPAADQSDPPVPSGERVVIEQAKGLLMAVHGCDASSAWEILRSHARAHDVGVQVMAGLLVAGAPGAAPPTSAMVMEDVMAERARAGPPAE